MVRRAFSAAALASLAAAGVASASLLGPAAPLGSTTSGTPQGCPTAASSTLVTSGSQTTAATRTAAATTAVTVTVGATTTGTTTQSASSTAATTTSTATGRASTTVTPAATQTTATTTGATTGTVATTLVPTTTGGSATTTSGGCSTTATTTAPALVASNAASTLVLTGHGFGHGMGMAQWGADGYALHGWTAPQILAHYYQGTTLGTDAAPDVRVLLAAGRRATLDSASPWRVVDARGTSLALPAGRLVVGAALELDGKTLVSPLTFTPGATPLELGSRPYRGSIIVVSNGKALEVVNSVSMTDYLDGVVGSEMPSSWPPAALEAQAIAARSYALAVIDNVVTASAFDLYSDTRSQVYGGIDAESPSVLEAVRVTQGEVVLYDGKVATTYYSASSGGTTVSAAEALGTPIPYLVSVSDPYDVLSPYHDWGPVLFGAAAAGKALGLPGPLVDLDTVPGPSHHVESATAVGTSSELALTGGQVEADLGLRSTWFEVGWLALTPPSGAVSVGSKVSLQGIARGVGAVSLEAQPAGGTWSEVATLDPDDGAFTTTVAPQVTTRYRLAAGSIRAAVVTVPVAPAVSAAVVEGGVGGTVSPATAGARVALQREDGQEWTTVATTASLAGGAYLVHARLAAGSYRVTVAATAELAAGVSTVLTVG